MFNLFGKSGYNGDLTFRKKIEIDQEFENLKGSNSYIFGNNKIALNLFDVVSSSSGECLEYFLELIYNDLHLYQKYAGMLFEIGYQKQKNKKYEKAKKGNTSRYCKEIIENKQETNNSACNLPAGVGLAKWRRMF